MFNFIYNVANEPGYPGLDLGFFDLAGSRPGPRKVSRKTIHKRAVRNAIARKSRRINRQKGLGKVKWSWSPGPNGRGLITERQLRNK